MTSASKFATAELPDQAGCSRAHCFPVYHGIIYTQLLLLLLISNKQKERDLELAARIGQSLLKKNRTLTEQNDYLEERVGQITEEVCSHTHSDRLEHME